MRLHVIDNGAASGPKPRPRFARSICAAALAAGLAACGSSTPSDGGDTTAGAGGAGGDATSTTSSSTHSSSSSSHTASSSHATSSTAAGTGGGTGGGDGAGGGGGGAVTTSTFTVEVKNKDGSITPGVPVVSNDAAGAVFAQATTDATGVATLDVPAHGSVSAFTNTSLRFQMWTVFDPPAGVTLRPYKLDAPTQMTLAAGSSLQINATNLPSGITSISAGDMCTTVTGPSTPLVLPTTCVPATFPLSTTEVVVIAYAGSVPKAWGHGTATPLDGAMTAVQIAVNDTNFDSVSSTVSPIAQGTSSASTTITPMIANTALPILQAFAEWALPQPPTLTATDLVPSIAGTQYTSLDYIEVDSGSAKSVTEWNQVASTPTAFTLDPSTLPLVSMEPLDLADVSRPTMRWSATPGDLGSIGFGEVDWTSGTSSHAWTTEMAPSYGQSVQLPEVPPELAAFVPDASAMFDLASLGYFKAAIWPDYATAVSTATGTFPGLSTAYLSVTAQTMATTP